jgi:hypothetical protein
MYAAPYSVLQSDIITLLRNGSIKPDNRLVAALCLIQAVRAIDSSISTQ